MDKASSNSLEKLISDFLVKEYKEDIKCDSRIYCLKQEKEPKNSLLENIVGKICFKTEKKCREKDQKQQENKKIKYQFVYLQIESLCNASKLKSVQESCKLRIDEKQKIYHILLSQSKDLIGNQTKIISDVNKYYEAAGCIQNQNPNIVFISLRQEKNLDAISLDSFQYILNSIKKKSVYLFYVSNSDSSSFVSLFKNYISSSQGQPILISSPKEDEVQQAEHFPLIKNIEMEIKHSQISENAEIKNKQGSPFIFKRKQNRYQPKNQVTLDEEIKKQDEVLQSNENNEKKIMEDGSMILYSSRYQNKMRLLVYTESKLSTYKLEFERNEDSYTLEAPCTNGFVCTSFDKDKKLNFLISLNSVFSVNNVLTDTFFKTKNIQNQQIMLEKFNIEGMPQYSKLICDSEYLYFIDGVNKEKDKGICCKTPITLDKPIEPMTNCKYLGEQEASLFSFNNMILYASQLQDDINDDDDTEENSQSSKEQSCYIQIYNKAENSWTHFKRKFQRKQKQLICLPGKEEFTYYEIYLFKERVKLMLVNVKEDPQINVTNFLEIDLSSELKNSKILQNNVYSNSIYYLPNQEKEEVSHWQISNFKIRRNKGDN